MILTLLVSLVIGAVGVSGCVRSEVGTPERETLARVFENVSPQEAFDLIQSTNAYYRHIRCVCFQPPFGI